jgi:PHS family inorganic phosphate transporter-like MFS transporter
MGRIRIQLIGFTVLTVIFVILATAYHSILNTSVVLFVVLYTVAQFFFNFGPNATTFVIPGEVFPTRYRSTGHGIAAASGKAGAILASYAFGPLANVGGTNKGIPLLLGLFSIFMFIGLLFTFLLPETQGRTLEDICDERVNSADLPNAENGFRLHARVPSEAVVDE